MKTAVDSIWSGCLEAVRAIEKGEHIQAALDKVLKNSPSISKNLCTDWVYAYYRFECRADFILKKFLKKPEKLPQDMIIVLKLALTALFVQDGRPEYAIVSGATERIKQAFGFRLAGVANAVLRNVLKQAEDARKIGRYKEPGDPPIGSYARFYGMPVHIARLWSKAYGEEAAIALLRRSAQRPWQGIRFNALREDGARLRDWFFGQNETSIQKIGDQGVAIAPEFGTREILGKSLFEWREAGALEFQAAGSQMVLEKLGIGRWEGSLWDACAGVGGKSLALLSQKCAITLASDTSRKRLGRFTRTWPAEIGEKPVFAIMDAAAPALAAWHGNILADVPCSGLGVLARRPELRKSAADLHKRLDGFQKTQMDILRPLCALLQKGKRLAYITCTLNPAENEDNINRILAERPDLRLEQIWQTPYDHPWLEGMFGAVLVKNG